jgi:hypothetical protein
MEAFQPARHGLASACRSLATVARLATAFLFLPLFILYLKIIDPGPIVREALKVQGRAVFVVVIIVSFVAAVDSFLSIVASYRRLSGFPWGPSLLFAAGSLNIIMALHWLLPLPLSP